MRTQFKQRPLAFVVVLALTAVESPLRGASIGLSTEPLVSVVLHEPVIVSLTLRNVASSSAQITVGRATENSYRILVTRPNGERRESKRQILGVAEIGWVTLAPGAAYSQSILLNEWASFDTPGRYSVSVTLPDAIAPALLQVEVAPPDPAHLRVVCQDLASVALAQNVPNALSASRALSFVDDSMAVTFLASIAAAKEYETAFDGLERIGGVEVVDALAAIVKHGNRDAPRLARSRLLKMRETSKDAFVKAAAEAALSTPR